MKALIHSLSTAMAVVALLALAACATSPSTTEPVEPAEVAPVPAPTVDLWTAAGIGDIEILDAHKREGTDLDGHQPDLGATALTIAAIANQPAAAAWLIDNGADVNASNRDGGVALHGAVFAGQAEITENMLAAGATVSIPTANGLSVWDIAAIDWETTSDFALLLQLDLTEDAVMSGRKKIVAMLEPYRADLARADIWTAVATGSVDALRGHVGRGADVNVMSTEGATMLSIAALFGHRETAAILIEAGAELDAQNETNGSTAIHGAAAFGRVDIVRLLLDKGADANATTWDGATPLQAAELDWPTTSYIAEMLNVDLDEETAKNGKAESAELLAARQ